MSLRTDPRWQLLHGLSSPKAHMIHSRRTGMPSAPCLWSRLVDPAEGLVPLGSLPMTALVDALSRGKRDAGRRL